jgi:nicotinate-nucleotide pyrophosphorylase (carboxylating)
MSLLNKELNIKDIVSQALAEDIGTGDITTRTFIPKDKIVEAVIIAKENFLVCGLSVTSLVFRTQDKNIRFKALARDGEQVKKGKILARISGRAVSILTCERVAINFLGLLSGIATKTKKFIEAVKPYKVRILDTRKTIPGLRLLSKYAVRIGGGFNHRLALDEMVMLKDNHGKILNLKSKMQNFAPIIKKVRSKKEIEIEVRNLKEFKIALKLNPDIIMLDNMKVTDIKKAIQIRNAFAFKFSHPLPKLEASGGINLKNVKRVAATGVEMISIGALTHSIDSVDISLELL